MEEKTDVFVFPPRYEMQIRKESDSDGLEDQYPQVSFLPGNNYEEVRQIREYRDGDSVRHIHWNQTARRDSLWVKEYEEETKGRAVLFLDLKDGKESVYAAEPPDLRGAMRLTLDLVWFKGEDLIFRFSEENLGQELSRQNFEL